MKNQRKTPEQRLIETYLSIYSNFSPKEITVSFLCRKAGVSRSLFYDSFSSLEDFARTVFDHIKNRSLERIAKHTNFERFVVTLLEEAKRNRTYFAFYVQYHKDSTLDTMQLYDFLRIELGNPVEKVILDYENNVISKNTLILHAVLQIICKWMEHSDSMSSREAARLIVDMVVPQIDYIENFYKSMGRKIYEDDWGWYEELVKKLKNDKQL